MSILQAKIFNVKKFNDKIMKIFTRKAKKFTMQFRKLQFEDIPSVKEKLYLYAPNRANDYTITGLFLWRDYFNVGITSDDEGIYVYQNENGRYLFYFPLCKDLEAGIKKIVEHCTANNLLYGFYPITANDTERLKKMNLSFEVSRSQDYNDYLYYVEELADFKGKAFHTHKNHVNKFDKEYSDFSFEKITDANLDDVKKFFSDFANEKLQEPIEDTEHEELSKIPELLAHMEEYNLFGYCLRIDGAVQSFELGEIVGDMYYSHIEKANRNIDGIYTKMVNLVAQDLRGKATFINREEDWGYLGLRASKQRYHPFGFIEKEMIFCN